eukprot:1079400-Amphidinium_carterae.1
MAIKPCSNALISLVGKKIGNNSSEVIKNLGELGRGNIRVLSVEVVHPRVPQRSKVLPRSK